MRFDVDLDAAPLLVIWEVTRACALACKHCRASAIDWRHPDELSTDEGKALLDDIKAMGTPVVVFTGGDPAQREDLEELIRYAKTLDLRVGTIPAATSQLTKERIQSLADAGIDQLAVSLDGSTAELHDELRQIEGTYDNCMKAINWIHEIGVPLQINTVFGKWNLHDADKLIAMVKELNVVFWEVFFLVPTGRGEDLNCCDADECEALFAKLYEAAKDANYVLKVTEGPHYRRYVAEHGGGAKHGAGMKGHQRGHRGLTVTRGGINAGKGFAFVDHTGDVYPSGFLPIKCPNVREQSIITTYREDPTFLALRDTSALKGVCGSCRYKNLCGGSRARAYALTGDFHQEDPCCVYVQSGTPPAAPRPSEQKLNAPDFVSSK